MSVVLVTGAGGFAGGHLLEHLSGAAEVVAWTRRAVPAEMARLARWETIDLLDRQAVRTAIASARPQRVFHLAGVTQVGASWNDPAGVLAANVLATHHLFDALRRSGLGARVVLTGSAAVYAASAAPVTEGWALAPDSPYALSKLAQEALAIRAVAEDGIQAIGTRSFNHTGPRQSPAFVAPSLARQVALITRGDAPPVVRVGNLDSARDLTDVRDVVRAYALLMEGGQSGEIYNVASGRARSIREILAVLLDAADVDARIETDPERLRAVDKPVLVGDASKLRSATRWEPGIGFEEMLEELLEYWMGR